MTVQDELRGMDLFEELSDEQLDQWAAVVDIRADSLCTCCLRPTRARRLGAR